jgi:hypothetical protein
MVMTVTCPHCKSPRPIREEQVGKLVACAVCRGEFQINEPPRRPRPVARPVAPEPDESYDDPPREHRSSAADFIAQRLATPASFLLAVGVLQVLAHFVAFCVMLFLFSLTAREDEKVRLAVIACVLVAVGFSKDALVLRGWFAMRKGEGYARAKIGAIACCLPDIGWIFALIPGIWCLVVLSEPRVRDAFNGMNTDDEDDGI